MTDTSSSTGYSSHTPRPSRVTVHAPGRVNLIGEHTDYNGGLVLPCAIDQSLTITATLLNEPVISLATTRVSAAIPSSHTSVTIPLAVLEETWTAMTRENRPFSSLALAEHTPAWSRYGIGAWCALRDEFERTGRRDAPRGVALSIEGDLPTGGGLSSSAALSTGILAALCSLSGIHRSRAEIARSAMLIEHRFVGTKCGLMDQLAILESRAGHLTKIDFSTEPPCITLIPVSTLFDSYQIIIINSGVSHSLATSAYNQRRHSCESALVALNNHFSVSFPTLGHFASPAAFAELWQIARDTEAPARLPLTELFTKTHPADFAHELAKRTRHVIGEILRVERAIDALTRGDTAALDAAMRGSHQSLRDEYEVSCDEIELLASEVRRVAQKIAGELSSGDNDPAISEKPPILGPRLCGGGFGGSVVQLVRTDLIERLEEAFSTGKSNYQQHTGIMPRILRTGIRGGLSVTTDNADLL